MKKHLKQMSKPERSFLYGLIRNESFWMFTNYSIGRSIERIVSKSDVLSAIKKGSIVEYHNKDGEHRILIRGTELVDRKYVVCVVVEPRQHKIVTVYVNEYNDNHATLDWRSYDSKIDIIQSMRGEFSNEY